MKLYFYRGEEPNFGDELNEWLLPRVFPDFFDDDPANLFLGIGSVLFDHHPKEARKIVFGSGYGGYTDPPVIDHNWDFFCVRGPLTAERLGLAPSFVAGDTAILINRFRSKRDAPSIPVSFIPHFQSLYRGHWPTVCRLAGIHYIDPRLPVADVLDQIEDSQLVVTEAMHGAIVSDALRVPWVAVQPFDATHHMKWRDWAGALDMEISFEPFAPSSLREWHMARRGRDSYKLRNAGAIGKAALKILDSAFLIPAVNSLRSAAKAKSNLSSDMALARALNVLEAGATSIRRKYG